MRLGFLGAKATPPKTEVPKALCFTPFEPATTHFVAEWRRWEAHSTDFYNRKLKKRTHPWIPSDSADPPDPVRGLLLGTSRPHAPGVRMT